LAAEENITALGSTISDGLGLGLICLDSDCCITFWNDWMVKHSGINSSEILGRNIFDKFPTIIITAIKTCVYCNFYEIRKKPPGVVTSSIYKTKLPFSG
jgi:hypothetical protein